MPEKDGGSGKDNFLEVHLMCPTCGKRLSLGLQMPTFTRKYGDIANREWPCIVCGSTMQPTGPDELSTAMERGRQLEGEVYQATVRLVFNKHAFDRAVRSHAAMMGMFKSEKRLSFVKPAIVMTGDDIDRMRSFVAAFSFFVLGGEC